MIPVSRLTLGTAQLGSDYGIANKAGKPKPEQAINILDIAFRNGINSIDTSYSYGDSESIIGSFLSNYKSQNNSPFIISKLPQIKAEKNTGFEEIYKLVKRCTLKSLTRLGLKRIPLYLLHSASDMNSHDGMVLKSLIALKEEGIVDMIGVSVYHPEEAKRAIAIAELDAVQFPVNLFDHRFIADDLLLKLRDAGKTIFTRSVYLQGLFFTEPENLPPALVKAGPYLKRLYKITRTENMDIDELALGFVKALPGVLSLVVGAESEEQVLRNTDLINQPELSPDIRKTIMKISSDIPSEVILPYLWNAGGARMEQVRT